MKFNDMLSTISKVNDDRLVYVRCWENSEDEGFNDYEVYEQSKRWVHSYYADGGTWTYLPPQMMIDSYTMPYREYRTKYRYGEP